MTATYMLLTPRQEPRFPGVLFLLGLVTLAMASRPWLMAFFISERLSQRIVAPSMLITQRREALFGAHLHQLASGQLRLLPLLLKETFTLRVAAERSTALMQAREPRFGLLTSEPGNLPPP